MDHLLEANKVASLMRRRENPKQIPVTDLIVSSSMEQRDSVAELPFPAGHIHFDFRPLRPILMHLVLGSTQGYLPVSRPEAAPPSHGIDEPVALPVAQRQTTHLSVPARKTPPPPAGLAQASLVSLPCRLPGPGISYRECDAVLRVQRKAVFEFGRLRIESPGARYLDKKRRPHLTPQVLDIPAQERSADPPPETRRPASRPYRCTTRHRPELPVTRPIAYDLLSIAIFSDPRSCSLPTEVEHSALIRPLRVPPPIGARAQQKPRPLPPAGGARSENPRLSEPEWKFEKQTPTHNLHSVAAGSIDFAARPPIPMAGVFSSQTGPYHLAEVPFAPPDSAFDYTPIPLYGSLAGFAAEAASREVAALEEDFNSGLGRWTGDTAGWKLDVAGARPAGLALLEPSLGWIDYDFEFLTRITKRGVTFVVRASDTNNYHRFTISPSESGGFELRRAVVIDGNEQSFDAVPAGKKAPSGSAITVKARLEGSEFTIFIDGEVAAQGTEERLPAGGIGFASLPGEQARLYKARLIPLSGSIPEAAPSRPPRSIS